MEVQRSRGRIASRFEYQPRRPVPWRGWDVLVVFAFYLAFIIFVGALGKKLGIEPSPGASPYEVSDSSTEHAIVQLMSKGSLPMVFVCFVSAVIVAPIYEEFFFRILFQGWLESLERRARRWVFWLRLGFPMGAGPILLTSLLFASQHYRTESPKIDPRMLTYYLSLGAIASLATLVFAVEWLRWRVKAKAVDFGWVPQKMLGDCVLGGGVFLAMIGPIYALQILLITRLPKCVAPDPIPLFFLALVLGFLVFRTHRIVPCIVVHGLLNATSLAMLWIMRCL